MRMWIPLALTAFLAAGFWFARPPIPFRLFMQGLGGFDAATFGGVWLDHALALTVFLAWLFALLAWGRAALAWFWPRGGKHSLRNDLSVGLGFLLVGTAVIGVGFLGLLNPWFAGLVLFLPLPVFFPWRIVKFPSIEMSVHSRPWLLALLVPLLAALPGVLSPEGSWDSMVYHLRFPSFWLMEHKHFLAGDSPFSAYPVLMETHYCLALALKGGEGAAKMMHAACWVLTARLVWKAVRPLGLTAAYAGALLWMGIPLAVHLAGTCYVDLATAWMTALSAALIFSAGGGALGPSALLAGIFASAAFMTKYTGAFAILGGGAIFIARGWKPGLLGLFCAGAAIPGGVWLLRNWLELGNMLYPFFSRVLGGVDSPSLAYWTREQPGPAVFSPLAFAKHLWTSCSADEGGVGVVAGPLWLAVSVTALFHGRRSSLWFYFAPGLAAWILLGLDVRFLLPLLPVAIMAASPAWTDRRMRVPLFAAVLLLMPPGLFDAVRGSITQFDPIPPALGLRSRVAHLMYGLTPSPEYFSGAVEINACVPRRGRIMMINSVKSYYIDRRCVVSHQHIDPFPLLRYARSAGSPDRLAKRLRQQGITWVVYLPRAVAADVGSGNMSVTGGDAEIYVDWLGKWTSFKWRAGEFLVYSINPKAGRRNPGRIPVIEEMAVFDAIDGKGLQDSPAQKMLAALSPESSSLHLVRAVRVLLRGVIAPSNALADLNRALASAEVSPMAWRARGFVFLSSGDPSRAVYCYRNALYLSPSDAETRFEIGHALLRTGDRRAGIAEITTAVRLAPDNETFRRSLDSLVKGAR